MALSINSNIQSLNSQRHLANSQNAVATAMQRLSSGVRINSAKDDAAGLAISDRMTSQIRGMSQAARNLNDGISMLQTAEGALQEITNLIQRGRELAVQAGNEATLSDNDKASLQGEVSQLLAEIDRIAQTTEFNGTSLLDQGGSATIGAGGEEQDVLDGLKSSWLANSEQRILSEYKLSATNVSFSVNFVEDSGNSFAAWVLPGNPDANGIAQSVELTIDLSDFDPANTTYDRLIAHEMTHAIMAANTNFTTTGLSTWFKEGTAEFIAGGDERLGVEIANAAGGTTTAKVGSLHATISAGATFSMDTSAKYASAYAATRYMHAEIKSAGGTGIDEVMVFLRDNPGGTLDDALADIKTNHAALTFNDEASFLTAFKGAAGVAFTQGLSDSGELSNADVGAIGGADADGGTTLTAATVVADSLSYSEDPLVGFTESWPTTGNSDTLAAIASVQLQAGANEGETISVTLGAADATTLNIADVDISANAGLAITRFDQALNFVDSLRGHLGASMNRLESSIAGLMNSAEQTSAARSRILDADIAQETSALTKGSILQQAGVSILTQANQQPQLALSLLQ